MFLHKILLMYILIDGSRSNPTFFKFFKPIKIEDSQIPDSSVAYPETKQDTVEVLETETESNLFLKPILIDNPNNEVPLRTETEHSSGSFFKPIRIGPSSKKQASFQFPVINKRVQKTINGGPGRQTEQRTSLPQESNSFPPQEFESLISQELNNFFSPPQPSSFLPQEFNSLPQESNPFLPQEFSSLPQESNTLIPPESNPFIPQKLHTLVVKSTTTPAPETSKAIVQGFRVIGDPSNTVVFLDLKALKESGIDVSSPTISIGPNSLEIIEGLQTEAPTNEKPDIPASAPTDQRLTIPAPTFVTKATAQPPSSSEFKSLKPSRLPESIKKFSVSLKSDKPPVFFSRKLSSSPSSSSQDFSNFPVESVSSSSLASRGFFNFPVKSAPSAPSLGSPNFPVKSSVFQAAPKVPLRHGSSIVDTDGLSGGLPIRQPDAGTSPTPVSLSHLLVDDDPLVQLESLKKFKVPGSFTTSSASLSEGAQSSFSTGEESLKGADHLQHHQQHQPQQIRQEQEYLLRDHDELSSGEEILHGIHHLPPFQQHHPQLQLQLEQAQEQQQDFLHGEHSHISPTEETSDEALLIPLHQHQQQLRQHQQQLQQVRQQEQESILGEHVEFSSGEEIPHALHHVLPSQQQHVHPQLHQKSQQDVQEQRDIHGEDHLLSGQETRNEVHHLLPLQQQQHQQHLHLHQQQLQEHQQQVDELKQQFQQLRKHQLQQLKQQQESIHRFSLPLEEEIAFNEDLEEAFRILG